MYAKGRRLELQMLIRMTASVAAAPGLLLLVVFLLAGEWVLGMVYGNFYSQAAPTLALLAAGQLVNVVTGSGIVTLMMTGHQKDVMAITTVAGALMISIGWVLMPQLGITGVALAFALGNAGGGVAALFCVHWRTGMWTHVGIPDTETMRRIFRFQSRPQTDSK